MESHDDAQRRVERPEAACGRRVALERRVRAQEDDMRDHEKAALVNELTALAKEFSGTQQLRERIAYCVLPAIEHAVKDERDECAEVARRWGETHEPGITVNARNAGRKIADGIMMRSNVQNHRPCAALRARSGALPGWASTLKV